MTQLLPNGAVLSTNFPGGNIRLLKSEGNTLTLAPDQRDSFEWWFYWCFSITTPCDLTLRFVFEGGCLGYYGPAISRDRRHWSWFSDSFSGQEFEVSFNAGETLYFAHNMVYSVDMWKEFLAAHNLPWTPFCRSNKGREVPCLELGDGDSTILLTSRHHACESTGTYVLQGIVEEWLKSPIPGHRLFCIPFTDLDGVIDGDQGKSRTPHDHNRDYNLGEATLYNEIKAIEAYIASHSVPYFFDFHSPWHTGGENDFVFHVENTLSRNEIARLSAILEATITPESLPYSASHNHPPNTGWNTEGEPTRSRDSIISKPEFVLSATLETCYFGLGERHFTQERALELGHCYGKALARYIATRNA